MKVLGWVLCLVWLVTGCVTGQAADADVSADAAADATVTTDAVVVDPTCGFLDEDWSKPQGWTYKGGNELGPTDGDPLVLVAGDELVRSGFSTRPASGRLTLRMRVPDGGASSSSQIQLASSEGDWGLYLDTTEGSLKVDLRTMANGFMKTQSLPVPTPSEWFLLDVFYDGVDTTLVVTAGGSSAGDALKGFSPTPSNDLRLQAGFHMEVERLTLDLCHPKRVPACTPASCGQCAVCDPLVGCATAAPATSCDGGPSCLTATCISGTCTCVQR